jgi:hypothetical protein
MVMKCKYDKPWIGKCNVECNNEYCEEHQKEKCCVCGQQATHGCDNTQFLVCGTPLCDNPLCDTIHKVYSHNWEIKDFMEWTGRKHTEEEIQYVNKYVKERKMAIQKILDKIKSKLEVN